MNESTVSVATATPKKGRKPRVWTPEEDADLAVLPLHVFAVRYGVSMGTAQARRKVLNIKRPKGRPAVPKEPKQPRPDPTPALVEVLEKAGGSLRKAAELSEVSAPVMWARLHSARRRAEKKRGEGYLALGGDRYGKVNVLIDTMEDANDEPLWLCKCDCGQMFTLPTSGLCRGQTRHCGCVDEVEPVEGE